MTLVDEAQQLLREGRVVDAERAFERVLEEMPNHIEALNVVALSAMRAGQTMRAMTLLEHAAATDTRHAVTQHHLGIALSAAGKHSAAVLAQSKALALQPDMLVARLYLAQALEGAGEQDRAVFQYLRALEDAQQLGHWQNAATTPPRLISIVEHAVVTVREHRREALAKLLEPLSDRYGFSSLERVIRCLRIYLKDEAAEYPDPRQSPTKLFFPGLPTAPYLDRSLLPWLARLESATDAIRSELKRILPTSAGRERVFKNDALEEANLRGVDRQPSWNGYYFYRYGERREAVCAQCPQTARELDLLPLCRIPENAPEVLFSVFTPGTHLLPHKGVTNTRLVGHLPLLIPSDCALRVGGELHNWQEGKVVVFDDTYDHEAWNRSNDIRVVLIFDIWNPHLTEAERAAITAITGDFDNYGKQLTQVR